MGIDLSKRARLSAPLPPELRALSRLFGAIGILGLAAGLLGSAFFVATEVMQWLLMEKVVGYRPLRALGETFETVHGAVRPQFRIYLLPLVTTLGGLLSAWICTWAPETQGGGGGNAMIAAYHDVHARPRLRVLGVRALASILALGSGGSGGREGPTMQMGGVLGAIVARLLRLDARERRLLYLAGVAAGVAAVFRTPLGAALLAVEIVYRDDFAADALVPAILASVVAYATAVALLGDTTLFGSLPRYLFSLHHLPLYAAMAGLLSAAAALFSLLLGVTRRAFARLPGPIWLRPAVGGLLLGLLCMPIVTYGSRGGQGLGLLGPSYGAAQLAISGAEWLGGGWHAVRMLLLLALLKMAASCMSIGSGASTGDFGPSLILGSLFGSAFGHAALILLDDPSLQPGAFALVGMTIFYGGLAHVPLTILVMVCELAGSYDLLVPLMLAGGIAYVLLRNFSLYPKQIPSKEHNWQQLERMRMRARANTSVAPLVLAARDWVVLQRDTPAADMLAAVLAHRWQDVFPVADGEGRILGVVDAEAMCLLGAAPETQASTLAVDVMQPMAVVDGRATMAEAIAAIATTEVPWLAVCAGDGSLLGMLRELDLVRYNAVDNQPSGH